MFEKSKQKAAEIGARQADEMEARAVERVPGAIAVLRARRAAIIGQLAAQQAKITSPMRDDVDELARGLHYVELAIAALEGER